MPLTMTVRSEFAALLARSSDADKKALLVDLARELLERHPQGASIPLVDGDGVVGYLARPSETSMPQEPVELDPELLAELERRLASDEPRLTTKEFKQFLDSFGPYEEDENGEDLSL